MKAGIHVRTVRILFALGAFSIVTDARAQTAVQVSWTTVGTSIHSSIDRDDVWPPASFTVAEGDGTFGPASVQMMSGPVEVSVENCPKNAVKEYDLKANTVVRTFRKTLDQVYLQATSGLGCIFADGSVTSESRSVVIGGTGRFENATGELTTRVAPQSVSFSRWNGEVNSLFSLTEGTLVLEKEAADPHQDELDRYERLWNAGDIEELVTLYTADSITLHARSGRRMRLDELRAALPELTQTKTKGDLIYRIEVGNFALERTRWTSRISGEGGERTVESDSYVVSRRQPDGHWLIVIDDPGVKEVPDSNRGDVSEYEKIWNARDLEALASHYTYDSITLQADGKHLDLEELRAVLPELTKRKTHGKPIYRIEVGDIALEQSRWTTEIPGKRGSQTVETDSYVVSRRQPDGRWLILIDDPGFE